MRRKEEEGGKAGRERERKKILKNNHYLFSWAQTSLYFPTSLTVGCGHVTEFQSMTYEHKYHSKLRQKKKKERERVSPHHDPLPFTSWMQRWPRDDKATRGKEAKSAVHCVDKTHLPTKNSHFKFLHKQIIKFCYVSPVYIWAVYFLPQTKTNIFILSPAIIFTQACCQVYFLNVYLHPKGQEHTNNKFGKC